MTMNRSTRRIASRTRGKDWIDGENFEFTISPKRKMRRDTSAGLKRSTNKVSPQATNRRKSMYLKRLETDLAANWISSNSRRTRQSLANLPKAESKTSKTRIPRAKSEKTISNKIVSKSKVSSPAAPVNKRKDIYSSPKKELRREKDVINPKLDLRGDKDVTSHKRELRRHKDGISPKKELKGDKDVKNVSKPKQSVSSPKEKIERESRTKQISKLKKVSSDVKKEVKKHEQKNACTLMKSPISKGNFYSKSPAKTRQILVVRRNSMIKMAVVKLSPIKQDHKPISKASAKSEGKKSSVPKQRSPLTKDNTKTTKSQLKKPVKRLSVSTPSPRPVKSRRLTRSAVKKTEKKVHIFAKSPSMNADFRKTPKLTVTNIKNEKKESPVSIGSQFLISKLKPYTPKPDEPAKILKNALKKNIAAEMRNIAKIDVSKLLRPSISSVRTPTKLSASLIEKKSHLSKNSTTKLSLNGTTPTKNGIHHESSFSLSYHMPATPLSSRKSTASFRRYRGAVRLTNHDEDALEAHDTKSSLLDKPLSSTPMRNKLSDRVPLREEEEELMDISEFSTSAEESKYMTSFNNRSFGFNTHSVEEFSETSLEKSSVSEQPTKRSFCSLM